MVRTIDITCRYGITYKVISGGNSKANARMRRVLGDCCCYMCENDDCDAPYCEESTIECKNQICKEHTSRPYCKKDED